MSLESHLHILNVLQRVSVTIKTVLSPALQITNPKYKLSDKFWVKCGVIAGLVYNIPLKVSNDKYKIVCLSVGKLLHYIHIYINVMMFNLLLYIVV